MVQMTTDEVVVDVMARIGGYERDLNRARAISDRNFDAIARSASKAETRTTASMARTADTSNAGSPVTGFCPMFAAVAPMRARSSAVTSIAHCRK